MEFLSITLLTILAAFIGTTTGFGISSIMLPVLTLSFPLHESLLLVGIIHFFGDLWKVILFRNGIKLKLIVLFGLSGVVTSYIGASYVFAFPEQLLTRILSLILIFLVSLFIFKPQFKLPQSNLITLLVGLVDGLLAGLTGIGGPIRSAFLSSFNFPKVVYIAASGAIGMMIDTVRISTYIVGGIELNPILAWGLIAFIPASFLGAIMGQQVISKIPQERFRYVVGVFLLIIASVLLVKSSTS